MRADFGGPIYALLLEGLASGARSGGDPGGALLKGLRKGVSDVELYGRAAAGDRTLLDALVPAVAAGEAGLAAMAAAASAGAAGTAGLRARAGRASYVAPANYDAKPDAGAAAVALAFAALARAFE